MAAATQAMTWHTATGISRLLACLAIAFCSPGVNAAGTAAGTVIESTAIVDFSRGGATETANSNTITLVVAERLDVIVSPQPGQQVVPAGAGNQALMFTVTNLGNGSERLRLAIRSTLAGDDFDPTPALPDSIYFDTDGSGGFNTGDVAYTAGNNDPVLAPDASVVVFLVNDIPATLANGDVGRSELTAVAATGSGNPGDIFAGLGDGGTDAVVGDTGAAGNEFAEYVVQDVAINVIKTQSIADPAGGSEPIAGATITYTITVEVVSAGTATASYINDPIPTWSTFVSDSITLNGAPISDATDGDAGEYDSSGVPAVILRLGDLTQADGIQTLVFQVTID